MDDEAAPPRAATSVAHGLTPAGRRRVLAVLCATELTSWGVLFYAFPVLAPQITADTGWPATDLAAAFSAALVVCAVVGVPTGRWLDRVGPRPVMTLGSVIAVPALVVIARAHSPRTFLAGWLLAGVAMAGVLYPPGFAALTRWWGPRRVTALTTLTALAGLASTVFAPVAAQLSQHYGWRRAYLLLAIVLALVTIPAHLFGLRGTWPPAAHMLAPAVAATDAPLRPHDPDAVHAHHEPAAVSRSRPFVVLLVVMGLGSFTGFAVIVNQVPLLIERGLSAGTAAWALGLGGLGQVLGRFGYARLARTTTLRRRTVLVLATSSATTALLAVLPGPTVLLIAAAMVAGAARGNLTLLQATAVSDRWGALHYGRLSGLVSVPVMLATASAPWVGAAVAHALGRYAAMFAVLAGICAVTLALAPWTIPVQRKG